MNIHAIKIRAKFLCQFALILAFKIGREERGAQLTTDPIHDNVNTTTLMNGSDGSYEIAISHRCRLPSTHQDRNFGSLEHGELYLGYMAYKRLLRAIDL